DVEENLLALEKILRSTNIRLVRAASGQAALALLLKHDVACVLLDVRMPDMSGFEVAKIMREDKDLKNTPIIFVTAEALDQQEIFQGYDSGAVDYLIKPLS